MEIDTSSYIILVIVYQFNCRVKDQKFNMKKQYHFRRVTTLTNYFGHGLGIEHGLGYIIGTTRIHLTEYTTTILIGRHYLSTYRHMESTKHIYTVDCIKTNRKFRSEINILP